MFESLFLYILNTNTKPNFISYEDDIPLPLAYFVPPYFDVAYYTPPMFGLAYCVPFITQNNHCWRFFLHKTD